MDPIIFKGLDSQYLIKGDIVEITSHTKYLDMCSNKMIYIDDHQVLKQVKEGTEVTLKHGHISLKCTQVIDPYTIKCKVVKEGEFGNCEFISFRGVTRNIPVDLSNADLELIEFAKEFNVSFSIIIWQ